MKHQITFLTIVTIILNVVCCKPDCKEGGTRYAEDLYKPYFAALFPYAVKQDIRFLKNGTDTILFYNQGYESGYNSPLKLYLYAHVGVSEKHTVKPLFHI